MPNKNIRLDEVVVTAPYNRAALWDMTSDYATYQLNEFFDKLMNKYRKKRKNQVVKFQSGGNITKPKNVQSIPTAADMKSWFNGLFSYITGSKDKGLIISKYKPSKQTNNNSVYYTRKGLDYDVVKNILGGIEKDNVDIFGKRKYYKDFNDLYTRLNNKQYKKGRELRYTDNSQLGEYTVGVGQDDKGRYMSYYDVYDWAPEHFPELFNPYEIYNRIYEEDFNNIQNKLKNMKYKGSNPSGNWFFGR